MASEVKIFNDTWGWLTLRDKRESRHAEVKNFYKNMRRQRKKVYTSDYVLKVAGKISR